MLDSLYTEALRKKGLIHDDIEEIIDKDIDIDKYWTNAKVSEAEDNLILAAGDGSFNKKKFLSFYLYAVAAESLIYNPNDKLKHLEMVELDIIKHQNFVDERLRNKMGIFEIKTATRTLDDGNVDYYMDDGSILGDLIRPLPRDEALDIEVKRQIANEIYRNINETSSLDFREEFEDLFTQDNEEYLFSYLETVEHLIALKNLLKYNEKIIAVSKTSTTRDLFYNPYVPDMAILDRLTRLEGYSKPIYKKVDSAVKHDFPVLNNYFRDMWFTIFFTRLEDNRNIIKVELPYFADENQIKKIISVIKSNSAEGYPYLLKKAHHDVVIKNTDIDNLSKILEIIGKSGREML